MKQEEKTGRDRMKQEGKKRKPDRLKILPVYALGFLVSVLLIGSAFLAPQAVFGVQDNIRCGKVEMGELESMDIASFNTGYETDLYRRLERFAEGLSKGRQYYVADQEMRPDADFVNFWTSEQGAYQEQMLMWFEEGTIPFEVTEYDLQRWKQYVIYGDDFSAGVNFILWYVELANPGTPTLKLLLDGETGEIYGLSIVQTEETLGEDEYVSRFYATPWIELAEMQGRNSMEYLWYMMAYEYGGVIDEALFKIMEGYGFFFEDMDLDILRVELEILVQEQIESGWNVSVDGEAESNLWNDEEALRLLNDIKWECSEDKTTAFFSFPYGKEGEDGRYELVFCWRMSQIMYIVSKRGSGECPVEFVLGFPEIYGLIPEFADSVYLPEG
ncbi:MAG: hypothetical protein NC432_06880 [Roseburia sp.]|nr:hypothetical protein [Roseburia sp.]MCM1098049.1 hypothetical protein [Ruminococcus flavefaciens]